MLQIIYLQSITLAIFVRLIFTKIDTINFKKEPKLSLETLVSLQKPEHVIIVLAGISYALDCIVHTFFAMKYWQLSHRLQFIIRNQDENKLNLIA
jgi:hypothetical protein